MSGFAGVTTTGIYCQPSCGAQPLASHVRRFPLAAAAEAAGYRACMRCRPYRLPEPVSWTDPELVCRAVSLILDGALDGGTECDLGRRLDVSGRHLRRLFTSHLGVTPDGLARSARAHFARRLLDDTDLTITEIAFAAGFGSLRQFNRACRDVFRAPPRDLRAKRRKTDRLVADGGLLLRLPFLGALDWPAMFDQLAARAIPDVECVAGMTYRRTIVVGGHPGMLELLPGGHDHLVLRAHLPHWEELIHVVERARRIASLDLDMDTPLRRLASDGVVGPLIRARPGVRPPGTWDGFEAGIRAIVQQEHELGGPAVNVLTGRLAARHGMPLPGLESLGLRQVFPTPSELVGANLGGLGLTPATKTGIRAFARAVAIGDVRLDRSISLDRLIASISTLDGLTVATAQRIAYRLGEPDACPPFDGFAEPGEAADAAVNWRPWRALAFTHLAVARGWSRSVLDRAV